MQNYIGYFFQSVDQALTLAGVAIVWLSLTSLGSWIAGKDRLAAADFITGWAMISLLFTLGGVFTPLSFSVLSGIALIGVALAFVFVARREGLWIPIPFFKLLVLAAPLLLIASAMQGSQWDEFSDWLAIPRSLYGTDRLPGADNPYPDSNFPAYPFSWHYINYLVSSLVGKFLENVGPVVNVLLLLSFSLALLNVVNRVFGDDKLLRRQSWALIAFLGLATTLFNPTFAQKIVLTTYADTSTAVAAGFAIILAWFTLENLSEGNRRGARNCAIQLSMALVVLINLKQATFAIFGLIVLGFLLTAYRDRSIGFSAAAKLILLASAPAMIVFISWRFHVARELTGGEAGFMPFAEWHLREIPEILLQMLITLLKKGYYFGLVLIIAALSLKAVWKCEKPLDRLLLLSGFLIVGYNAFLFFIYVSSFGIADALRVASYWRYNMHMGAVVIAAAGVLAVLMWQRHVSGLGRWRQLAWLPIILLVASPLVFAKKLRFDLIPMVQHYRYVGGEIHKYISADSTYFVLDPHGSGESYNITIYELNAWGKPAGYLAAYHDINQKTLTNSLNTNNLTHVLLHSVNPAIKKAFQIKLLDNSSQLLEFSDGAWKRIASWPLPKNRSFK